MLNYCISFCIFQRREDKTYIHEFDYSKQVIDYGDFNVCYTNWKILSLFLQSKQNELKVVCRQIIFLARVHTKELIIAGIVLHDLQHTGDLVMQQASSQREEPNGCPASFIM